jgi:hypothetical protein
MSYYIQVLLHSDVISYCMACNTINVLNNLGVWWARFKEHIRGIKNNGQNSKFAQHILDTGHEYETIEKKHENFTYRKKGPNARHIWKISYTSIWNQQTEFTVKR